MKLTQTRILIIDDNIETRYAIGKILTQNGCEVEEAITGFEGLKKAQTQPDLILLDMQLPDINGLEVCRQLKKNRRTSLIPVLQISAAFTSTQAQANGLDAGADAYLVHPIAPEVLISTIGALLRARQAEKNLRESEERYKTIASEMDVARKAAEAANIAKSEFLANMSHEIRTPLGAIIGFAELALNTHSEEERADCLSTIMRNGQLLHRLIGDILDLSKIEAGNMVLEILPCPLRCTIADVIELFKQQAAEKSLEINVTVADDIPHIICTDATRLKQVLFNIIGNAIKFTAIGSVSVVARRLLHGENSLIEISVTDTGVGLSPEQAERLFQPFVQADASTTRRFGGTGLGLILSRRLARALGGDVHFDSSRTEQGSRFVITISDHQDMTSQMGTEPLRVLPTETKTHSKSEKELDGVSVLVVEDAPDNRLLLSRILKNNGASVKLAGDGEEGVKQALSNEFDIVLMDMQMPVKDGVEATAELRRKGYRRPILALTASAFVEERRRSLAAGCNDHLTKPFSPNVLVKKIRDYVNA